MPANQIFTPHRILEHKFVQKRFAGLALAIFCLWLVAAGNVLASTKVIDLRSENLGNPEGIDATQPRLSWVLKSSDRGQKQTAYQVLVACSEKNLESNRGDLWDSGKVASDQSIQVPYAGRALGSHLQCFWKVRIWDKDGKESSWSKTAHWSMGLLASSDWTGKWIGLKGEAKTHWLDGTSWIWYPEGEPEKSAPVAERFFRRTIDLPANRVVRRAALLMTGDNEARAYVNGDEVASQDDFHIVSDADITHRLVPGINVIAIRCRNVGEEPNPAGVIALLKVEFEHGEPWMIATDGQWKTREKEERGWSDRDFDDSGWREARKLGTAGMDPWGHLVVPESRRLPARWLRKEFVVEKKVARATVHYSGLGLSELYLNGSKVGDQVLSPALSEYAKRVYYVTADVTKYLKRGGNALGVVLGNGRFYAPRGETFHGMRSFGFPKLLLHLRIEYMDGSVSETVSDESWKLTANGPITANNEYDGEEYNANKELTGWSKAGYDDTKWQTAKIVPLPEGTLAAQMIEPIRVTQTLKPVALTEPKPGIFIFDMGQNMVGWCRLKVSGPARTQVVMRFAETLKPDGTLYLANIRGARVTDKYILKGEGTAVWEPRFTYHGFRYVEVTGFPGRPTPGSIEGRVVHDDLASAGDFTCSNPLLNRIYQNVLWGTKGNYRSIPTDCPQRDERQGWLGDRSEESKGESYMFDVQAFCEKWLQDMADAQKPSGSVPDVAPAYWPFYSDDVTWPSTSVILPESLYDQFADISVVRRHYDSAKKWVDHMRQYVKDGIISKDSYGDWCVPPEDPTLIHSKDPERQTSGTLLATAYFYHDLRLLEGYAAMRGDLDEARHFGELAEEMKAAFNKKFLNRDLGQYDNGTQTSCILPLAFGLAPDDMRTRIFDHLVGKITVETKGHIGTGLIGGQYLMRVLSDNGRADLACTIASQKDYPSWGYMVEKGATTIWELWNGDTADPAMNSGNHLMLVGDLVIWLYEDLAGIKSDPRQPGFKHIIMNPQPVGDLKFVKATHVSPYGLILSEWRKDGGAFDWRIEVPPNATATIYMPAKNMGSVLESRKPALKSAGVLSSRYENGRAVFDIGSGKYHFLSQ